MRGLAQLLRWVFSKRERGFWMSAMGVDIPGVKIFKRKMYRDERGFFFETFRKLDLPGVEFVQDNLSFSAQAGTVRGIHFQVPPCAQAKLITVIAGAIFDVVLDLRRDSPTYARWMGAELNAESMDQLFIPAGLAHGFCTLLPDTLVTYKVDSYYSAAHERGILWDDPDLNIAWPVRSSRAILSDKDRALPPLSGVLSPFQYQALEPAI